MMVPYEDERPLEKVYHSAVAGLYARLKSNYDFLYRKLGDKGLALIADMSRDYGRSIAQRAAKSLQNNDIDSIARYILRIFDTVTRGTKNSVELHRNSDEQVIISVTACPLNFALPDMCRAHTEMEKTFVETMNPALTYRIGKSIPAGYCICEHIIERKSLEQSK